jgi:hypothetical protein
MKFGNLLFFWGGRWNLSSLTEVPFQIKILKNKAYKIGWEVRLVFSIGLHVRDKALLESIKKFLGVGNIGRQGSEGVQFRVLSIKQIKIIFEHFSKYPLITNKLAYFLLFKKAYEIVMNKEHLTPEGLNRIIALKANLNLGLSEELIAAFEGVVPVERPVILDQKIRDPHWVAGFTTGEGCFFIRLSNNPAKPRVQVQLARLRRRSTCSW